jgi:hypothetical protein
VTLHGSVCFALLCFALLCFALLEIECVPYGVYLNIVYSTTIQPLYSHYRGVVGDF